MMCSKSLNRTEKNRRLEVFYTSLYRALLFPRRLDEETPTGTGIFRWLQMRWGDGFVEDLFGILSYFIWVEWKRVIFNSCRTTVDGRILHQLRLVFFHMFPTTYKVFIPSQVVFLAGFLNHQPVSRKKTQTLPELVRLFWPDFWKINHFWVVATQIFIMFTSSWGKWSNLTSVFFKWVGEKRPTRFFLHQLKVIRAFGYCPQLGPQKKNWMSNSAVPFFSMGIFLVGLLVAALVYGGRIYQNTWILVCWTCVLDKNQLIHVSNDCLLGEKKQNICHLQSLNHHKLPCFWDDKNTMESSSTNPKTIHGTGIFVSLPVPIKNNQPSHVFQGTYTIIHVFFHRNMRDRIALPRWLGFGLGFGCGVPRWLPRNTLQVFNTGVHTMGKSCRALEWVKLGHASQKSSRSDGSVDLAMYIYISIIVEYICMQWQEGRKHCYCLKLPVSTPTHDFPGCPVAYFDLMVDFFWGTDLAQLFFPFRLCVSTGFFLRIFEQG